MILITLNGLWRAISPKAAPRMNVGETKNFKSWGEFAEYGRTHTLNEADFDIKIVGAGFQLSRVK